MAHWGLLHHGKILLLKQLLLLLLLLLLLIIIIIIITVTATITATTTNTSASATPCYFIPLSTPISETHTHTHIPAMACTVHKGKNWQECLCNIRRTITDINMACTLHHSRGIKRNIFKTKPEVFSTSVMLPVSVRNVTCVSP